MLCILLRDPHLLLVYKPPAVPAQPDPTGDKDILTLAAEELASSGEPSTLYPVHRLDRVTGGVMVLARDRKSAAALSALIPNHQEFCKQYFAVIPGILTGNGEMRDFLVRDPRQGKAFVVARPRPGAKEARLHYTALAAATLEGRDYTLISVRLFTGRFHQIRVQFASRGYPLVGDGKYGSREHAPVSLFAAGLSFSLFNKEYNVRELPPLSDFPWSLFDPALYGTPHATAMPLPRKK